MVYESGMNAVDAHVSVGSSELPITNRERPIRLDSYTDDGSTGKEIDPRRMHSRTRGPDISAPTELFTEVFVVSRHSSRQGAGDQSI